MRRKGVHHVPDRSSLCAGVSEEGDEIVTRGTAPYENWRRSSIPRQTIRNWVAPADREDGRRGNGLTARERKELSRSRRENKQLRIEREILSRAEAWFARETDAIPQKESRS